MLRGSVAIVGRGETEVGALPDQGATTLTAVLRAASAIVTGVCKTLPQKCKHL
jgi:uracil phosphoribosyltransferase